MDLGTLKKNLDAGLYSTREEFCDDAALIFSNASLYNKGHKDSAFVLKLAESMTNALERLRRNAEKRILRQSVSTTTALKGVGVTAAEGGGGVGVAREGGKHKISSEGGGGEAKVKTKKISIKLKRKSAPPTPTAVIVEGHVVAGKGADDASGPTETDNPKPVKKAKTKLSLSATGKAVSTKAKIRHDGKTFEAKPMTTARRAQCWKVLASLKRRQSAACKLFHKPVSDPAIVKIYKERILNPMDLSAISSRLVVNRPTALQKSYILSSLRT